MSIRVVRTVVVLGWLITLCDPVLGMQIVGEFSDEQSGSKLWLSIDRRGGTPFGGGTKCAVITVKDSHEMLFAILKDDDWEKFVECWNKAKRSSSEDTCDVDVPSTPVSLYFKDGWVRISLTDAHSSPMGPDFVLNRKQFEAFTEKVRAVSKFFAQ